MCKRRPARTLFILGCLVFYLVLWTMEVKLILVADHHQRHGDDAKKKMTTKHVVPSSFGSSPREESSSLLHHDFPPPRIFSKNSNAVVVIIVLSARGNSERRQAIRETWASSSERTSSDDVPPVCFVLGAPASCNSQHSRLCQEEELLINATENGLILREQARHGDLLMISTPESYRSLPYKVSGAYTWISNNCARAEWIVKVDDDMYVKTDSIAHYLQQLSRHSREIQKIAAVPDKPPPMLVGCIHYHSFVFHNDSKWDENEYENDVYPPYALGSCGHAVNRPIMEYIAKQRSHLKHYSNEDTSIGIWLNESTSLKGLLYLVSSAFHNQKDCQNEQHYVVGHGLSIEDIKSCHTNHSSRQESLHTIEERAKLALSGKDTIIWRHPLVKDFDRWRKHVAARRQQQHHTADQELGIRLGNFRQGYGARRT